MDFDFLPEYCRDAIDILQQIWQIDQQNIEDIKAKIKKSLDQKIITIHCFLYTCDIICFRRPHRIKFVAQLVIDLSQFFDFGSVNMIYTCMNFYAEFTSSNTHQEFYTFYPEDSLERYIFEDDFDKFVISIEQRLEDKYLLDSLLIFACESGSIQCFKYLIAKGATLSNITMIQSIKGGNYEIIHIVERQCKVDEECMKNALIYHRPEIVRWLEQNYNLKYSITETLDSNNFDLFFEKLQNIQSADEEIDNDGNTILHYVSEFPFSFLLKYLIDQGNSIDFLNNFRKTPLFVSCEYGIPENLELLMSLDAKINCLSIRGEEPINIAASNGHASIIRILCEHGVNVDTENSKHETPLINAINGNHLDCVKELIKYGANIESHDELCMTPLMNSVRGNKLQIIQYLIDRGVNLEATTPKGSTAIFFTSLPQNFKTFLLLEKNNADIYHKNELGIDIFIMALKAANQELIRYLLEKYPKFNVNEPVNSDISPLIIAAKVCDVKIVELLLDHGANIDVTDGNGNTPLMLTARFGRDDVLQLLIQKGADVKHKNNSGENALIVAVIRQNEKVVEILLSNKADPNVGDECSPLYHAAAMGSLNLIQLLLHFGAKPTEDTLVAASMNGHSDAFQLISSFQ
ncbi:hypothetical protein TVAG_476840 [Trichomonas vaginalis G3]|uniref:DUF3447 domain-containing protein n=1 Tax=Trichomonas vaginalis (strain ATCC PRA-98 / G3) TaxID=412133 RepID=A2DAA7_TRIV3|nr:protein ubiquitination [Trichomonas vaginalis G3]EAY22755.1 hypothetical protein TVAG_476840 [Trichomonas vaginalis G3]KAI5525566.1 protein ubiquitination [Trichomonas vaginalis G3]|eukprot:XP_001583741.1 hypothetical protein [Trichomonas vaginalis G3]